MLNREDYKNIAENCSSYSCKPDCRCTNMAGDEHAVSCTTCKHFTEHQKCDLDLIDPIVKNHNI